MSPNDANHSSSEVDPSHVSARAGSDASFVVGDLDSEHGVILKDWSAQDFANIYVRFRPHLISQARKFLWDEALAEEVVQDAFLYLMTALPDLDSELGVLRFLKWKTRLLCLDVIRRDQARGLVVGAEYLEQVESASDQVSERLEQADDAAIVRLALAQIPERQRHVLIETVLNEKSNHQVAIDMGMNENALRQLVLRARRSFRIALVGQAEISGMSISEALRIATKRIPLGSVGVLALLATLSLTVPSLQDTFGGNSWVAVGQDQPLEFSSGAIGSASTEEPSVPSLEISEGMIQENMQGLEGTDSGEGPITDNSSHDVDVGLADQNPSSKVARSLNAQPQIAAGNLEDIGDAESELEIARLFLEEEAGRIAQSLNVRIGQSGTKPSMSHTPEGLTQIQITSGDDGKIVLVFASSSEGTSPNLVHASATFGGRFLMAPQSTASVVNQIDGSQILQIAGTDFLVGELAPKALSPTSSQTDLTTFVLRATFELDQNGEIGEILSLSLTSS